MMKLTVVIIEKCHFHGTWNRMAEMRNIYKSLVGIHEGKRPHGRPNNTW